MANDVVSVLRGQLAEVESQASRLRTAIAALEGADMGSGRGGAPRQGGPRKRVQRLTGASAAGGRKRRRFSAATRAKMAAAQKARWAKRKRSEG